MEPIYCFEYKFKTKINNKIITGFAINDYKLEDILYGVNKAFISRNIMHTYKLGGLVEADINRLKDITKLSFDKVLVYYNHFVKAVEYSNKQLHPNYIYDSYIHHCKEYKYYYEKLVELMQLIIAKWDDWN